MNPLDLTRVSRLSPYKVWTNMSGDRSLTQSKAIHKQIAIQQMQVLEGNRGRNLLK